MSQKLDGTLYPKQIFMASEVIVNAEGKEMRVTNCYDIDPFRAPDKAAHRLRLDEILFDFFGGVPSPENPLLIQIKGLLLDRCEDFNPGAATEILEGRRTGSFEDMSGRHVSILPERSKNGEYPFVGVVYEEGAEFPVCWGYDADGNCNDGDASHRLLIMKAVSAKPTKGEHKDDPGEAAPEEENNVEI